MGTLRKHWKKFVLSVFATLWTACSKETVEHPEDVYGCPSEICDPDPSEPADHDAVETPVSSASESSSRATEKDTLMEEIRMQPLIYGPPSAFDRTYRPGQPRFPGTAPLGKSSSSSEPDTTCKHENEVHFKDLFDEVKQEMYAELIQELDGDGNVLTAEKRVTLESFLDRDKKALSIKSFDRNDAYGDEELLKVYNEIGFEGIVFKTRTCSDGTEEVTDLYKERAGKIRCYIQGLIDSAWDKNP